MVNRNSRIAGIIVAVVAGIFIGFNSALGPLIADFMPPNALLFVGGMALIFYGLAGFLIAYFFRLAPWITGFATSLPVLIMVVSALLSGDQRPVVFLFLILPFVAASLAGWVGLIIARRGSRDRARNPEA